MYMMLMVLGLKNSRYCFILCFQVFTAGSSCTLIDDCRRGRGKKACSHHNEIDALRERNMFWMDATSCCRVRA